LQNLQEVPRVVLTGIIGDSLTFFVGYYGEVQATVARSADLRLELFEIVDICVKNYPGKLSADILRKIWYLLYIIAVCGAKLSEIKNFEPLEYKDVLDPYIGLAHTECEFKDYRMALCRLTKRFESEIDAFPLMVEFIRKFYDE
jgi:hypothetical protein